MIEIASFKIISYRDFERWKKCSVCGPFNTDNNVNKQSTQRRMNIWRKNFCYFHMRVWLSWSKMSFYQRNWLDTANSHLNTQKRDKINMIFNRIKRISEKTASVDADHWEHFAPTVPVVLSWKSAWWHIMQIHNQITAWHQRKLMCWKIHFICLKISHAWQKSFRSFFYF